MARRKQRRSAAHCKALSDSRRVSRDARKAARYRRRGLELGANAEWLPQPSRPSLLLAPVRHVLEALEPTLPPDSDDRKVARWWLENTDKAHRQYLTRHPEIIREVLSGFAKDSRLRQ
jgi:hypothetical protein